MKPKNLQTVIAYRNQELRIDLGKEFEGILTASMSRNKDVVLVTRDFEIEENRYLILKKEDSQDNDMDEEIKDPVLGRWYFDVRQVLDDKDKIIYTGTIFFEGNITQ